MVTTSQSFPEKKDKHFRLFKYIVFTSLMLIFAGSIVFSFLNTRWARTMQLKKNEDYALLLIANLNHQVYVQFIIPVALKFGKIQLSNKEQFNHMDKVVRSTLHSFKVDMVNIYDLKNTTVYSFEEKLIGRKNFGGSGYQNAVAGRTTSKQVQRGNWLEIILGIPKDSMLITFAPLRMEKPLSIVEGPIVGVVEITQDLSADYKAIINFQRHVFLGSSIILGILFFVLLFLFKWCEGIVQNRALESIKLREKLNKAERFSSMGKMASRISHEIRNPLGIISNSAELLKKKMTGFDPSNKIPDVIVEESGRLNNIITDFINFAKPRNPNLIPCRIEEVLEKNITFLSSQIKEQKYTIKKQYSHNLPEIMADSSMLYQAFLNIFINAMQAMPEGGLIKIQIDSNEHRVAIVFEDEGCGIPGDLLEKIWDPFFTTKEKGTGLGLGIVKNLIEIQGGSIRLENNSLRGARVIIELPVN